MVLKDCVALVTGASSGIGFEIAKALKEEGAIVYGTSRKSTQDMPFEMIRLDIKNDELVDSCVKTLFEKHGKIDLLINNAGFGYAGAIEDASIEESIEQFDVNFHGTFRMIKRVLGHMRNQRNGTIVTVTSVGGFLSVPYQGFYSATKYALEGLMQALAMETKAFNIKTMVVEPGDTKTGFTNARIFHKNTNVQSPYKDSFNHAILKMEKAELEGMEASKLAKGIIKRLKRNNIPFRYVPGIYKIVFILSRILPAKWIMTLMEKIYL